MRKLVLSAALMALALLLASGVALAATIDGTAKADFLVGTGQNERIFAGDGEQDLICVNPGSSGTLVTDDPEDELVENESC